MTTLFVVVVALLPLVFLGPPGVAGRAETTRSSAASTHVSQRSLDATSPSTSDADIIHEGALLAEHVCDTRCFTDAAPAADDPSCVAHKLKKCTAYAITRQWEDCYWKCRHAACYHQHLSRSKGRSDPWAFAAYNRCAKAHAPSPVPVLVAIAGSVDVLYVDEWLLYHQALGFQSLYLYDNTPNGSYAHLTRKYPDFVSVIPFPGAYRQLDAYHDALQRLRNRTDSERLWMAVFDIDEFLVLYNHTRIGSFLLDFGGVNAALSVHWVFFGTNGQQEYRPLPVTYRFTDRGAMAGVVKSIGYVPAIAAWNVHFPELRDTHVQHDAVGQLFHGHHSPRGRDVVASLHHYASKSTREFYLRETSGKATASNRDVDRHFQLIQILGHGQFDDRAWQFYLHHVLQGDGNATALPPHEER